MLHQPDTCGDESLFIAITNNPDLQHSYSLIARPYLSFNTRYPPTTRTNLQPNPLKRHFFASRKQFSSFARPENLIWHNFAAENNSSTKRSRYLEINPYRLCVIAIMSDTLNKTGIVLIILLLFCTVAAKAQTTANLSGRLYEVNGQYNARSILVTAKKDGASFKILTDTSGRFTFRQIPTGTYRLQIESQFYSANTKTVHLQEDHSIDILIERVALTLQDVVITASESKGMTSASIIDRRAMQHLQPSSFTDLLELLPGGRARDPNLTSMNQIRLREVGISDSKYDITSLGTAFVIDGAPINTTANLQSTAGYALSSPNDSRSAVNKGVDMRTLSTDQIEKVEITRGIASVEHGDLTSGLIQITRKKGASPYTARLKSDGFSKLVSVGKGFYFPRQSVSLNIDLGYLYAKNEPTNNFNNYQRVNGSVRVEKTWEKDQYTLRWSSNIDLSSNIDNVRVDPDNGYAPVDKYVSRNNSYSIGTSIGANTYRPGALIRSWEVTGNLSYANSPLDQTKWAQPLSIGIRFNATTPGDHDLGYMGGGYAATLKVDDQPLNAFLKAMTTLEFHTAGIKHRAKLGAETRYSKNLGEGHQYDINYPLNPGGIPVRPRAFNSIPGMLNQALFAEDMFTVQVGQHRITTAAGLRVMSLLGMDTRYTIANKPYIDPRINVRWQLPRSIVAGKTIQITVGGGYGVQTKMPTLDQLYPNDRYDDIVQLNFYHNNPAYRKANAVTYITDRRNFDIAPAINYKWEVNSDIEWGGNRLSITYFQEKMGSGFRDMSHYQVLNYKRYDTKSVDAGNLTAPPQTSDFTYTSQKRFFSYSVPSNGSRIDKEGIEYQFTSPRIKGINTRFTVTGAWFNSTYVNSMPTYGILSGLQVPEEAVGQYIATYEDDASFNYLRQQLNTNLTLDSYLPKLGLIISTSFQNIWFTSRQNAVAGSLPTSYTDIDGKVYPYTKSSQQDPTLRLFDRLYNETYFRKTTVPIDLQANIKVTKEFKKMAAVSMFVNRLFTYTPDFTAYGVRFTRQGFSSPYFGMELTLKF